MPFPIYQPVTLQCHVNCNNNGILLERCRGTCGLHDHGVQWQQWQEKKTYLRKGEKTDKVNTSITKSVTTGWRILSINEWCRGKSSQGQPTSFGTKVLGRHIKTTVMCTSRFERGMGKVRWKFYKDGAEETQIAKIRRDTRLYQIFWKYSLAMNFETFHV